MNNTHYRFVKYVRNFHCGKHVVALFKQLGNMLKIMMHRLGFRVLKTRDMNTVLCLNEVAIKRISAHRPYGAESTHLRRHAFADVRVYLICSDRSSLKMIT